MKKEVKGKTKPHERQPNKRELRRLRAVERDAEREGWSTEERAAYEKECKRKYEVKGKKE